MLATNCNNLVDYERMSDEQLTLLVRRQEKDQLLNRLKANEHECMRLNRWNLRLMLDKERLTQENNYLKQQLEAKKKEA